MVHGMSRLQGYKNCYVGSPFLQCMIHPLFWGVWGAWITFKRAEMKKPLGMGFYSTALIAQNGPSIEIHV